MFDDNYRSFRGDLELIIDKVKKKKDLHFLSMPMASCTF